MKKCWFKPIKKSALFILGFTLIVSGAQTAGAAIMQKAVSINVAADYSAGAHSVISVDPVGGPRDVQNDLQPTVSDLGLSVDGRYFYVIERYQSDSVTKYDIDAPSTPIWQFSAMNENDKNVASNPHNMVFATPDKAYLLRYGSSSAWIVNPETQDEVGFRTGSLDLSAYNDQDASGPEMTDGVIVNGKLFVVLQRLDRNNNWIPNDAYVAVFDTTTDEEIETVAGAEFKGIKLPVKNPNTIQYEPETGLIFVSGVGNYASWDGTPADYSGGIATINPQTFETKLVVDDGTNEDHPYGNISGMTVLSETKGYFTGYAGWGDNTVYEFNPTTGEVKGVANEYLQNKNIAGMNAGVGSDQNGMLWITNATDAEIVVINPVDNSIDEKVNTNMNPTKVVFVTYDDSGDDLNESSGGGGGGGCFISSVTATGTTWGFAFVIMAGVLALIVLLAGRQSRLQR